MKNRTNNSLSRHKKSDMIKWIVIFVLTFALIGAVGGIPTLAITIIIPIVIVWKIIRKIHYGYSLYR